MQEEVGLLTPREVAGLLKVDVRTIWRYTKKAGFPKPIRMSPRIVRWKATEIQEYLDSLKDEGTQEYAKG